MVVTDGASVVVAAGVAVVAAGVAVVVAVVVVGVAVLAAGVTVVAAGVAVVVAGVVVAAVHPASNVVASVYTLITAPLVGTVRRQFGGFLPMIVAMSAWHAVEAHILVVISAVGSDGDVIMLYPESLEHVVRSEPVRSDESDTNAADAWSVEQVSSAETEATKATAAAKRRAWTFIVRRGGRWRVGALEEGSWEIAEWQTGKCVLDRFVRGCADGTGACREARERHCQATTAEQVSPSTSARAHVRVSDVQGTTLTIAYLAQTCAQRVIVDLQSVGLSRLRRIPNRSVTSLRIDADCIRTSMALVLCFADGNDAKSIKASRTSGSHAAACESELERHADPKGALSSPNATEQSAHSWCARLRVRATHAQCGSYLLFRPLAHAVVCRHARLLFAMFARARG